MNIHNYNHLFYFYVTAKLNGVTLAAKHLNTSQSSLSTQIKTLEKVLDRELFKKSGRGMELTDAGRELYNYCRRAFEVFDEMFDQLDKKRSSMGVRISVGVSADIERPFVTDALAKVSQQFARGQRPLLNLVSLPTSQLLQLLRLGEIDLLLTSGAGVDSDLNVLSEFSFAVGAYVSKELLKGTQIHSLEAFSHNRKLPFVLPSKRTSLRSEIDEYFVRRKLRPTISFESNIISAVVRAASDQLGATILPQVYVARELKSEKLVALTSKPLWKYRMAILSARRGPDPGRKDFVGRLIRHFTEVAG